MPARTGRQYLNGLREQEREVWIGGDDLHVADHG